MKGNIQIFASPDDLAAELAAQLMDAARSAERLGTPVSLALSGGSTPRRLFRLLAADPYRTELPWSALQLYWGDERCVPPDHVESNYGAADNELLSKVAIPSGNIHRIKGENDPELEAVRYTNELRDLLPLNDNSMPVFDWIFLGLGADGHTASLFPDDPAVQAPDQVCQVSTHPSSGQKRVTLSLSTINSARRVSFLVTGREKAAIAQTIFATPITEQSLPAGWIRPTDGRLEWLFDQAAASLL